MRIDDAEQIAKAKIREYLKGWDSKLRAVGDRFVLQSRRSGDEWIFIVGVFPKEGLVAPSSQVPKAWWDDREEVRARDWLHVIVDRAGGARVEEVAELDDLLG
jgi:hypothetical protein